MSGPKVVRSGPLAELDISRAWLMDPATGREGPGDIVVRDGTIQAITWLEGREARGIGPDGVVVAPGFIDLHVHLREPGDEAAETIASGLAAAAHGGFAWVCAMADSTPAADDPAVVARVREAAVASGWPVRLLPLGAVTAGREGERLAALGELADAGAVAFSDDPAPIRSAAVLRSALAYAGMLARPVVVHAVDPDLADGAEAGEGLIATVLGLRGVPAAAEAAAVGRDLAVLADVRRDVPGARLHLAHLTTAEAIELVRRAKAAGLPVTCDVTPHHLALTDAWLAGSRRWAWDEGGHPWSDGSIETRPYASSLRVDPPLRPASDAAACLEGLLDGTVDAVATDHSPRSRPDREVEFGAAAPGIAGLETALGLLLAAVDAGRLPLRRAIEALTSGPARVLAPAAPVVPGAPPGTMSPVAPAMSLPAPALAAGRSASLVVFDRAVTWTPGAGMIRSLGAPSPLVGRALRGGVLLTVAEGRLAWDGSSGT